MTRINLFLILVVSGLLTAQVVSADINGSYKQIWDKEFLGPVIASASKNLDTIVVSDSVNLYVLDGTGKTLLKTSYYNSSGPINSIKNSEPSSIASSYDGTSFVAANQNIIKYYDGTEKIWDYQFPRDEQFLQNGGVTYRSIKFDKSIISYDGNFIAAVHQILTYYDPNDYFELIQDPIEITIYFFDNKGTLLWTQKLQSSNVENMRIEDIFFTQNDEIGIIKKSITITVTDKHELGMSTSPSYVLIDKNGMQIHEEDLTNDFSNLYRTPKKYDYDKWNGKTAFCNEIYLELWETILNKTKLPTEILISENGDRILFIENDKIHLISNASNSLISPPDNTVLNTSSPLFQWEGNDNQEYELKINDEIIKITGIQYRPDKLKVGKYTWSVRRVDSTNIKGWSKENSFVVVDDGPKIVEIINPFEKTYLVGAVFFLLIGFSIFSNPFYKRWMLKRKMVRTPTDWCPHCKKYAGNERICPHCGKNTLKSESYANNKESKK